MPLKLVEPHHVESWVQMYQRNATLQEIANASGRSIGTVWRWLKDRVELRPKYAKSKSPKERFDKKWTLEPVRGCWIWTEGKTCGYGCFKHEGETYAHRVSYILHKGPIPDGLFVLHECDNPACVNPDHLFLGDHDDNMADCSAKGRTQKHQAEKTHCPRGHPYSGDNLTIRPNGWRSCKACARERFHERKERAAA